MSRTGRFAPICLALLAFAGASYGADVPAPEGSPAVVPEAPGPEPAIAAPALASARSVSSLPAAALPATAGATPPKARSRTAPRWIRRALVEALDDGYEVSEQRASPSRPTDPPRRPPGRPPEPPGRQPDPPNPPGKPGDRPPTSPHE